MPQFLGEQRGEVAGCPGGVGAYMRRSVWSVVMKVMKVMMKMMMMMIFVRSRCC